MRTALILAAGAAALGLAGCDSNQRGMSPVSAVCKPFTAASTSATNAMPAANVLPAGDPSAALDDCLHRWGYALAPSTDPANVVADAALDACTSALTTWNQQALSSGGPGGAEQAPSLVNGQSTNPIAEHYSFAQARALFYVVQARAGHCGPPPLSKGEPTAQPAS